MTRQSRTTFATCVVAVLAAVAIGTLINVVLPDTPDPTPDPSNWTAQDANPAGDVADAPVLVDESDLYASSRYAYLTTLRTEVPTASTDQLLDYGTVVCDAMNSGVTPMQAALYLSENRQVSSYQAGAVVGAAVGSGLCNYL